jgi:hypothetical protein
MLPAKFGSIWPSSFRGEDFLNIIQSETRIALGVIFVMWVYNDKLQIKFTFRSGPIIFGRVMALGL